MKRAGDVVGVPQWQINPTASLDDLISRDPDQERRRDAADSLREAVESLGKCISWLDSSAFYLDGMPEAYMIISVMDSLEDIQNNLEQLQKTLRGGE